MTDYNNIYVDLSGPDALSNVDSDGAPICEIGNPFATGSTSNPLSFEQFTLYIRYRLNMSSESSRTFYLKGSIEYTKDFGSFRVETGVMYFNSVTDEYITVDVVSWVDNTPYKLKIHQKTDLNDVALPLENIVPNLGSQIHSVLYINTHRVGLRISNMQLETGDCFDASNSSGVPIGGLVFRCISNDFISDVNFNRILLSNCLFVSDGTGVSTGMPIAFGVYEYGSNIELYNNIFYSKNYGVPSLSGSSIDGSIFGIKEMHSGDIYNGNTNYVMVNNMFFNIGEMYLIDNYNDYFGKGGITVFIHKNIFSTDYITVLNTPAGQYYVNLFEYADDWTDNLYSYPVVSLLSAGVLPLTLDDLQYTSPDWIGTSAIGGVRGTADDKPFYYNTPNSLTDVFGKRDGIGPLYFPELPSYRIDSDPRYANLNDNVHIFNTTSATYDTNNIFNEYVWDVDSNEYYTTSGAVSVSATSRGISQVSSYIKSFNGWYDNPADNYTQFIVTTPGHVEVDTYLSDSDTTPTHEFEIGTSLYLRISNLVEDTPSIVSMGVTWGDPLFPYHMDIPIDNIQNYGDVINIPYTYNIVGDVDINVSGMKIDGISFSENVSVRITDVVNRSEYYVDFDAKYESDKDISLAYGLYDDFEDGHINGLWNADFFNEYNPVTLWHDDSDDKFVAIGINKSIIMSGIKYGKFNTEFSFVRKNISCTPRMYLNIDGNETYIEWDYIQDSINIYDASVLTYVKRKYGVVGNKDLTCSDSLRRIWVKVEFDPLVAYDGTPYITMRIYGKTKRDNAWISLYNSNFGEFNSMTVKVEGTYECGFGEILMEADYINETISGMVSNGTEDLPFTYSEFVDRITDGGDGEFRDIYHCRGYREAESNIIINDDNFYEIDAWDSTLYGPWVINFYGTKNKNVSLVGCVISDGVIYNRTSNSIGNLFVTNMYNMFVTWNNLGKIIFERTRWIDDATKTTNIIGCTINSNNGFKTTWEQI